MSALSSLPYPLPITFPFPPSFGGWSWDGERDGGSFLALLSFPCALVGLFASCGFSCLCLCVFALAHVVKGGPCLGGRSRLRSLCLLFCPLCWKADRCSRVHEHCSPLFLSRPVSGWCVVHGFFVLSAHVHAWRLRPLSPRIITILRRSLLTQTIFWLPALLSTHCGFKCYA